MVRQTKKGAIYVVSLKEHSLPLIYLKRELLRTEPLAHRRFRTK